MDLCHIHIEDVFGPSLGRVWRSRSKVKVTRDQKRHFSALLVACVRFMFGKTSLASSCLFIHFIILFVVNMF